MMLIRDLSGMSKNWSSLYRSSRKRRVCEQKKGRECQRKESYSFCHYLNISLHFPKILKTTSELLESASGSRSNPRVSGSPSLL